MTTQRILRNGTTDDQEWLYELFKVTMREFITSTWGWDEQIQRQGFITSLPVENFKILVVNSKRAGGYFLTDKADHLVLDMILIEPELQRQGLGTFLMNAAKKTAQTRGKDIQLNVLHSNPAIAFHRGAGFTEQSSDDASVTMSWLATS